MQITQTSNVSALEGRFVCIGMFVSASLIFSIRVRTDFVAFVETGGYWGGSAHRSDGPQRDGRGNWHPGVLGKKRKKQNYALQLP